MDIHEPQMSVFVKVHMDVCTGAQAHNSVHVYVEIFPIKSREYISLDQ